MADERPSSARGRPVPRLTVVVFPLLVAAVVRGCYLAAHLWNTPIGFNDGEFYSGQAQALVRGAGFVHPTSGLQSAEHPPLTSIVMALVSWLPSPINAQRVLSVCIGLLVVAGCGVVAWSLAPREEAATVSIVALWIAALYPPLWLTDGLVMSENLAMALVLLWMLLMARLPSGGAGWRIPLAAGIVVGLGALTRSELALLAPFTLVAIARALPAGTARRVSLLAVSVGCAIPIAPWSLHNLQRFEQPVLLTTNDGSTWRGANCDLAYYGRATGSWSVYCLVIDPEVVDMEPSRRTVRWRNDALEYASANSTRLPVVLSARALRTLDLYGWGYQLDEDVRDDRWRTGAAAGMGAFVLLAGWALWGARRFPRWSRRLLLAPVLIVACTTILFYGGHRIRAIAEPTLVVAAAAGLSTVLPRRSTVPTSVDVEEVSPTS